MKIFKICFKSPGKSHSIIYEGTADSAEIVAEETRQQGDWEDTIITELGDVKEKL